MTDHLDVAELSDSDLIVWATGMALLQVEGALCLAVDPLLRGYRRSNTEVDACQRLSERLRELTEIFETAVPKVANA